MITRASNNPVNTGLVAGLVVVVLALVVVIVVVVGVLLVKKSRKLKTIRLTDEGTNEILNPSYDYSISK